MPPPSQTPAAPAAFRRRGHLVLSLLAVMIVVGLVPLATMAFKLIQINREALTTAQREYQLLLAAATARELGLQVDGVRDQVQRLAGALGSSLARQGRVDPEVVRRDLDDLVDGSRVPYLRYAYVQEAGLRTIDAGVLPDALEPSFASGLKASIESVARGAGGAGGGAGAAFVSSPVLLPAPESRALVVVSAPVVLRGAFRGVLSAAVDLHSLWTDVVGHRRDQVIFAVTSEGQIFASNDPARIAPGDDASGSPLVQRFLSGGMGRETMPFTLERDGVAESYLGSYEVTGDGWGLFVQAEQREVYLAVRTMVQSTISWAMISLGLAALAALVFSRSLSQPINRLAEAARAYARRDFSPRVRVASRNEVGELAHAFNHMAAEIEESIRRLKQAAEENRELFLGTIRALAQAIDAKDPYTRGHSGRVNRYAVALAQELGLSDGDIADIHVASLLHDVGKIGIDDHILKKKGALTREEFAVMKTHAMLGANIMAPIRQMRRMLPGLRHHHERWTGGGYPDGLRGDAIPLMARIIAVADTFDAVTTTRPYQEAMTPERAIARLNEIKGEALDERIVEAFNRLWQVGKIRLDPPGAPEPPALGDAALEAIPLTR